VDNTLVKAQPGTVLRRARNFGDSLPRFMQPAAAQPPSWTVPARSARVSVLLCTCHGQRYLADQLKSIANQDYQDWKLWVSDDGSQDDTHAILDQFQRDWGADRVALARGPARGFAANFLSLACNSEIDSDYYAYSDQDDIWEADKLQRAVAWLKAIPREVPALYCSRTELVDAGNRHIGYSPLFSKAPSFANAIVQNIGGGNTMVFNEAARRLLCEAGNDVTVVSHDWWAYIVVTGCGGKVFYDAQPSVRYRQHGNNLVGRNTGLRARLVRLRMLWQGRFRKWHDVNLQALQRLRGRLTPENRRILDTFAAAREGPLPSRLRSLLRSGVYRQTLPGNAGLVLAAIFKKL
jgi:glycosyltransferase involved in cell wall biosynthesis